MVRDLAFGHREPKLERYISMTTVAYRMVGTVETIWALEASVPKIDLTPSYQDALHLMRLRKQAKRLGLKLSRSRWHSPYVRNHGGLILLDDQDNVVVGDGYSLDLADVERILTVMADLTPPPMP